MEIIENNEYQKIIKLLEFYSKKSNNNFLVYKIALNPAILNTHSEINKDYWKKETKNLEKEVKSVEQKNKQNKETKRLFEEELEAYINHILYKNNFFKESENEEYKKYAKEIFEKYNKYIISNTNKLKLYEEYVLDIIKKHKLKDISKNIEINENKNENKKEQLIKSKKYIENISFIQLKILLYRLSWKKNELAETENNYSNLLDCIKTVKQEINARLKYEIKYKKTYNIKKKTKYWKFISTNGKKAKTAQKFWQKFWELLQKNNFDAELNSYTHFWFIVQKWKRFFILPFKKEKILNKNWWFTLEDRDNLLKKYENKNGNYLIYTFDSLTLKALTKLIFIKNAFEKDFKNKDKEYYNIWKQKKYLKTEKNTNWKKDLEKYISFLVDILNSEKAHKLFPYLEINFKNSKDYNTLQEFEKDLLKNAYQVNIYKANCNENDLIELDIVNRKFEYDNTVAPKLKRQNDIKLFVEWFFNNIENYKKNYFNKIRLLPEIKIYIRYKLKNELDIKKMNRYYKNVIKASFLFELNPLWIGKNLKNERKKWLNKILDKYKKGDLHIISIDIWEKEFATLWVYNKELKPQKIEVDWNEKTIINLTDLKVEKWKIKKIKSKISNSQKYKAFRYMFWQIFLWKKHLKEILKDIWEINIKDFNEKKIKEKISNSYQKRIWKTFKEGKISSIKKFFPELNEWFVTFLLNYIKSLKDKKVNEKSNLCDNNYYQEIFSKIQLPKVSDFKYAFGSNFVWVIETILKKYPWIIVFEALHTWETYSLYNKITKQHLYEITSEKKKEMRTFWTYVWMYIVKSLFNRFTKRIKYTPEWIEIEQDVILDKNYENSIKIDWKYWSNWIIFYINESNTSKACPICNKTLLKVDKNWILKEKDGKDDNKIYKLYWHLKRKNENKMRHLSDNEKFQPWKIEINWKIEKICDYNMEKNNYWLDFIKSWDDLATYNIAKKALEYLNSKTNN